MQKIHGQNTLKVNYINLGAMQASKGGQQPAAQHRYDACEPQQWPELHDNPKHAAITHITYG